MSSKDIGVLALGETRSNNTSKYLVGETTFITSSDLPSGREYAGVGVAVSRKYKKYINRVEPVSSRIMLLGLGVAPRDLILVIVYAPQDARSLDDKE
eukprot:8945570-Alexandrium_andersonii.AAC.1